MNRNNNDNKKTVIPVMFFVYFIYKKASLRLESIALISQ